MKKAAKKGRPKKFGNKPEHVVVRVTPKLKADCERVAESEEMSFSDWVRSVLTEATRRKLESASAGG